MSEKSLTCPLLSGSEQGYDANSYGAFVKPKKGPVLSYHDITYWVQTKKSGMLCFGQHKTKQILKGVSGVFKPGINAIIGPSGCGKTTYQLQPFLLIVY
jgi:ABC-type glutathione transport system ATPase component